MIRATRVALSLTAKPVKPMSREEMVARAQRRPWPPKPDTIPSHSNTEADDERIAQSVGEGD